MKNAAFEEALIEKRIKWRPIMDDGVNYHFPIPETTLKEMFLELAQTQSDKPYVYHKDAVYTYGQCNALAVKIANRLLELGLNKGDRIVVFVANSFEFIAIAQACFKVGVIMVNSNPRSTADEILRKVEDCTPKLLITDSVAAEAVEQAFSKDMQTLTHIVFCPVVEPYEGSFGKMEPWEALLSDNTAEPDTEIAPEDIAVLQYTGGTTGVLKGCCQTNRAYVAKAYAQKEYFKPILSREDYENYMVIIGLGMSHAFGFGQAIIVNMTLAGSIYLADDLDEILQAVEKYKPTVWPSVPLWMKMIASDTNYQKYDITSLKCITCGSAPLPVEVIRKVEELTGAVITEGYGMTETVNTITINGFQHRKIGTVGVPNPNIEYLIVDAADGETPVPDGQTGEIICRGDVVMQQYWNKPEETAEMVRDGWLYTGDIGLIDEEGYLVIKDRKKDLIITSGFNVFPSEIESIVMQVDGVADCIVIGIPDERRGEVPGVFIKQREGRFVDMKAVEELCGEKLSRYKQPRRFFYIDEIPKTKNNKPDRKKTKKLYLESLT